MVRDHKRVFYHLFQMAMNYAFIPLRALVKALFL